MDIQTLVKNLSLKPHPEGGYYREVYRSTGVIPRKVLGTEFSGDRNYSTSIYFLLTSGNFSAFHRIRQDELWHFYMGSPLQLHMIGRDGALQTEIIGSDISRGENLQFVVPGGCWFASAVLDNNSFSLIGCTVSPGFDFDDFELAKRSELITSHPRHEAIIKKFTRA